jgi:hypothetical protein
MRWRLLGLTVLSAAVLVGCGNRGADSDDPVEKIKARLAEIERNIDARTPKDQSTVALIGEAGRWYREPRFIWVECEDLAKRLSSDGLRTDPHDLLRGSIEVMKRLDVRPTGDQAFREYLRLYEMRRRDNPRTVGEDPMQHQAVLDLLVEQEKFGNTFSYEEYKARQMQPLAVGETVRLGSLSSAYAQPIPEDSVLPDNLRILNGTRAEIYEIEKTGNDASLRYIRLRILEGQYAGKRVGVSPEQIEPR